MTRLLTILFIMAGLAAPATAQDAAPAAEPQAGAAAEGAAPAATEEDDDDDEDGAATAEEGVHEAGSMFDFGFSGIMARDNRTQLAPLTLASGKPVAGAEYKLKSGGFYRIDINADGSQELALSGGDFFRAVWINEIVINDIEIRPMGVHSLEFDDAGTATISFIAVVPGRYTLSIPGSQGETQQAVFNIQ
ncbi:hypothetical protein SAMN05421641_11837 [Paracoccus thiocyanatus]|uniref:MSP domain-containing protein n=1 Tax=Paracoccus thiocyanatus TaxID=34006 RepID=A0A1N6WUL1_9RHOB|nr:hypothetical protein [Paracoccus thiocyanatus]SIQ93787.1 hypothetical protein SAMN05421641_11837 [Paracoccus thiocyanatus]